MTPEATPNDEFLSIVIDGGVEDINFDDIAEGEIRQNHQESLSQLHDAIATYAKKPNQKALDEIITSLNLCSDTFTKKMHFVLAHFDQPKDCIKPVTEEIAKDETWRSKAIKEIVANVGIEPAKPEDISAKLKKTIKKRNIDNVEKVLSVSQELHAIYMAQDLNKTLTVVEGNYNKRHQRYLSIGRGVLDVAKIAASAAVAIMLTKGIDRR